MTSLLSRFICGTALVLGCLSSSLFAQTSDSKTSAVDFVAAVSGESEASTVTGVPTPGPDLLNYTPEQIKEAYKGQSMPEAVRMYLVIAAGGRMSDSNGWFGPADNRFTWQWLADLHGSSAQKPIPKKAFKGPKDCFAILDRDGNGLISEDDLDWASDNAWVKQSYMINRIFRKIESSGDGLMTQQEWNSYFTHIANDAESIRTEQLRDAWLGKPSSSFSPGDAPRKDMLIRGLMAGEIGSLQEGPDLNAAAPDFELQRQDGTGRIRLSSLIGDKPIVLVFGNFTCGPFRSMYPTIEAVKQRHADMANFLMVYVREAHPSDGWAMKSNVRVGVEISQPKTLDERVAVAQTCAATLRTSMPLLVDDIDDSVGNAYSGMPARLYIIDQQGKVAYKSGRGPFGFKPEEMEQALMMLQMGSETR
ncbi:deiodinase family protein [Fuerstiella marisgermanici]|uniref:Iodothyronine deiodinase n=1 Tax=Fuerstiella marisgermanici TaxID=1891926 RepID=A0A1P8W8W1_9PLAN|nr:deiodinase family protein [Fuerstiella marisgermanici]APZ90506.1 Iodothyronine deiodinase [Fuerstiella marisgermanici]